MDVPTTASYIPPFLDINGILNGFRIASSLHLPQPIIYDLNASAIGLTEPEQLPALFAIVPDLRLVERTTYDEVVERNRQMVVEFRRRGIALPSNETK